MIKDYREYAFYVPKLDVIIFQCIMPDHQIAFGWDYYDLSLLKLIENDNVDDPFDKYLLMPLGEV